MRTGASADCVPLKSCKQLRLFVFEMCGEQGFKAVHKTVRLVKLIGKGCPFFFRVLRDCAIIIRRGGAEKLEGGHCIKLLPR